MRKGSDDEKRISTDTWTFLGYALVAMVLAGGSGIWLPMVMPDRELAMDSMFSFVMATVGPPTVDLVLRNADASWPKGRRMAVVVMASVAMAVALGAFLQGATPPWQAWSAAWIAVIGACACWVLANASSEDGKFTDGASPKAVAPAANVGGNPDALPGAGWGE